MLFRSQDFCKEYPFRKIKFQKSGGEFHDRYINIDWNTDMQRIVNEFNEYIREVFSAAGDIVIKSTMGCSFKCRKQQRDHKRCVF